MAGKPQNPLAAEGVDHGHSNTNVKLASTATKKEWRGVTLVSVTTDMAAVNKREAGESHASGMNMNSRLAGAAALRRRRTPADAWHEVQVVIEASPRSA